MLRQRSNLGTGCGHNMITSMSTNELDMSMSMSDKVSQYTSVLVNGSMSTFNIIDHHNKIENTTTRLAVQIQNHPPFPFPWDDNAPQKSCSELKEENILPNEDNGHHLYQQMMNFMMDLLVNEHKSLSDLCQFLPTKQHPPAHKSVVMPMKLLFRDEKYTDENIQIMLQLLKDANLDGSPQVYVQ